MFSYFYFYNFKSFEEQCGQVAQQQTHNFFHSNFLLCLVTESFKSKDCLNSVTLLMGCMVDIGMIQYIKNAFNYINLYNQRLTDPK